MARAKKSGRGSPEAVAKRRAARSLNRLFEEGGSTAALDGRTLKRKRRLIKELQEGKRGQALKAIEALQHVDELLKLGETLSSIRKMKPKVPPPPPLDEPTLEVIRRTQKNYEFDPKAWKVLGVDLRVVAGGEPKPARKTTKRSSKKKSSTRKTSRKRS